MKRSLDKDGNLVYNLGELSNSDDVSIPLNLVLKSANDSIIENVSLFEYIPHLKKKHNSYNLYQKDNIRILELNSLCRIYPEDNSIEEFLEDSKEFRGIDKLIIDLRGNTGGSMVNIEKWYKGFTGKKLKKDIVQAGLYTNTSIELSKNKFKRKTNKPDDIKEVCLSEIDSYVKRPFYPGWSPVKYSEFDSIENKSNIVILADKNTSSAAEFFIYYLKKLENVVIMGTVTNGCVLTGNCNTAYLPNSHIKIHISHKIYMSEHLNNIDGLGILPDYWVKPSESLDRAIEYLKNK